MILILRQLCKIVHGFFSVCGESVSCLGLNFTCLQSFNEIERDPIKLLTTHSWQLTLVYAVRFVKFLYSLRSGFLIILVWLRLWLRCEPKGMHFNERYFCGIESNQKAQLVQPEKLWFQMISWNLEKHLKTWVLF